MSYEDIEDYEKWNMEELTEEFLDMYRDEWEVFVQEKYDSHRQYVDEDYLYELHRDQQLERTIDEPWI